MPDEASRWLMVDQMIQELGALRVDAQIATYDVDLRVAQVVHRAIEAAVRAVDVTVRNPGDDENLLWAWEAIISAQDSVAAIRATSDHSRRIIGRSIALRR